MKIKSSPLIFHGTTGVCGSLEVFLGFGTAKDLYGVSFADVLNEETGEGYQRPRSRRHSLDFRKYIFTPKTSTIPLTFNLRKKAKKYWQIKTHSKKHLTELIIDPSTPCLAQIDCQHRIGELGDSDISLAFMTFIGLDLRAEMSLFVTINSKARGLSSSLTDYHESNLLEDMANDAPHFYIARKLNEDLTSPWHKLVKYGGENTSGLKRVTSFRMMQKTVSQFISQTRDIDLGTVEDIYTIFHSFWNAVKRVFDKEWSDHRHHLITKGLGLYSLTRLLADFVKVNSKSELCEDHFTELLMPLSGRIDWRSKGEFAGIGGQKGANEVHAILKKELKL